MKCLECDTEMSDKPKKRIVELHDKKIIAYVKECWNCGETYADYDESVKMFNEIHERENINGQQRIKIYGRGN